MSTGGGVPVDEDPRRDEAEQKRPEEGGEGRVEEKSLHGLEWYYYSEEV